MIRYEIKIIRALSSGKKLTYKFIEQHVLLSLLLPLLSLLQVHLPPLSVATAVEVEGALRRSRLAADLAASRAATEAALRRSRV